MRCNVTAVSPPSLSPASPAPPAPCLPRPQDNSADLAVSLLLAPSYVTYNAQAVAAVRAFFDTDTRIDIGTLQVGPLVVSARWEARRTGVPFCAGLQFNPAS